MDFNTCSNFSFLYSPYYEFYKESAGVGFESLELFKRVWKKAHTRFMGGLKSLNNNAEYKENSKEGKNEFKLSS